MELEKGKQGRKARLGGKRGVVGKGRSWGQSGETKTTAEPVQHCSVKEADINGHMMYDSSAGTVQERYTHRRQKVN